MNNKEVANKYGVALNLRGRARRAGVKTAEYVRVNGKQNMIIIGATLILFLLFTLISPNYASKSSLLTMIKDITPYAVLGLGVTFVIATGGIDLSIGTVMFASSVMAGAICKVPDGAMWLTIPLMLIFGLLFGLLNGFLIAKCKLPPFIGTLGTMLFSRGISAMLAEIITKKTSAIKYPSIGWLQSAFSNLNGFPIGIVWVLLLTIICMIVMFKTKVGRYILSIGSNEEATRLSGVDVDKYKMIAYAICGLFAGIAAIFWTASNPSVSLAEGNGKELDAIAGVYIGGTSTTGGTASIMGTIFGAIILVVIRQGLSFTLLELNSTLTSTFITYAVTGVIVVGAVLLDVFKRKMAGKVKIEKPSEKLVRTTKEKIAELNLEKDYALSAKNNAEAQARVKEIDAEIISLKNELKQRLPELKAADAKAAEEEKLRKAETKAAEKAEKANK